MYGRHILAMYLCFLICVISHNTFMYHTASACEVSIHIQATFNFSVSESLLLKKVQNRRNFFL